MIPTSRGWALGSFSLLLADGREPQHLILLLCLGSLLALSALSVMLVRMLRLAPSQHNAYKIDKKTLNSSLIMDWLPAMPVLSLCLKYGQLLFGGSTDFNIGALIIRKGFWGPLYCNYSKDPPKKVVLVIIKAPILGLELECGVSLLSSRRGCLHDKS